MTIPEGVRTVTAPRRDDREPTAIADEAIRQQLAALDDDLRTHVVEINRITRAQARLQAAHYALLGTMQTDRKEDGTELV